MRLLAIVIFSAVLALVPARAEEDAAEKPADAPVFVTLPPITVPVFEGDEIARQASLVLALELAKGHTEADLSPYRARLVDAFIAELADIFERRSLEDRVIDPQAIKPRLRETTARIVGPGLVTDVLIQQAMERARRR